MIDSFVLLTPILMLPIVALLGFIGCNWFFGIEETELQEPGPGPTNVQATPGNGKVVLTWDDYPGATGFNVKRGESSGNHPTIEAIGPLLTYTDDGLVNGTEYFYVVSAEFQGLETEESSEASATPNAASLVSFITSKTLGTLVNGVTGWFGMAVETGASQVTVETLGRAFAPGNNQVHVIKIVDSAGVDLPGGFVSVAMAGGSPGEFRYAALGSPLALAGGSKYFIVSQEVAGTDQFYNHDTEIQITDAATVPSAVRGGPPYIEDSAALRAYGVVNFQY